MRRPLIAVAAALSAGILLGNYFDTRGAFFLVFAALIPTAFLGTRLLWARKIPTIYFLGAVAALYGAAAMSHINYDPPSAEDAVSYANRGEETLEGLVVSSADRNPNGAQLLVDLRRITLTAGAYVPVRGRILLRVQQGGENLQYGDLIRFQSELVKPEPYGNPGAFRVDRYLRDMGVQAAARVSDPANVEILQSGLGNPVMRTVERARMMIRSRIDEIPHSPQRAIIEALVIGERGLIPESVKDVYRVTGTSHILSISGLHVGIIAMTFYALVFLLLRLFPRVLLATNAMKLAAAVTIVPTVVYCLLAGSMFPAVRSTIMVIVFLLAVIVNRHRDILSTIALAAAVILIFRPTSLFDAGMQLSFASVIGIVLIVPQVVAWRRNKLGPIEKAYPTRRRLLMDGLFAMTATSVSATAVTAPLLALYFNGFAIYSVLANLILVPLYSFFIIPACFFATIILAVSSWLAGVAFTLVVYAINTGHYAAKLIASLPGAYVTIFTPKLLEIAAFYAALALLFYWKRGKAPKAGFAVCLAVMFSVWPAYRLADLLQKDVRFTLIDVGQGECQLIELPHGHKILVNGGATSPQGFDVGQKVIAPYFWNRRIGGFDIVVSSHPDTDHFNGLPFILENFRVGELWIAGDPSPESELEYREFLEVAKRKGIPIRDVNEAMPERVLDHAALDVLWPPAEEDARAGLDDNNASCVLKLVYGNTSVLMPADIQNIAETRLLDTDAILSSNILVVPHHGGRTSSSPEFIGAVKPSIAIFSVGRHNPYHHPSPEVVWRYSQAQAAIFRTDRDGQIRCRSDGGTVSCLPFKKRKAENP